MSVRTAEQPGRARTPTRRARLARGPLTIGEPAARIGPRLALADPYRPDTVADGGEALGLTIRAASVRGLQKRYLGGARQDDLCLRVHPATRTLVVAVADGVSAAARADLAAALAVRQAVAAVARQLDDGVSELDWPRVFEHAAWALIEEHRRADGRAGAGIGEVAATLATTLLVLALSCGGDGGHRLQAAAVGDSHLLWLSRGRFERLAGDGATDPGLIDGGVRALPRHTAPMAAGARTFAQAGVLLACSDGLALPLADGRGEVGRTLARELAHPPDIVDFARLLDFSRATYDDDRTLVAIWLPGGPSRPAAPRHREE